MAQRWITYEFFYSDIDKCLFEAGYDDFLMCLRDMYPQISSREVRETRMTRHHYRAIKKHLGKPRRFSQAFLAEERKTLERDFIEIGAIF